ncbi:hypothetical protein ACHAXS_009674 [Conticribra weissflogii]
MENELIFLRRCKNTSTRKCSRFYLTIKMHKDPWKTRPVVSTCGTYLHALSRWVDHHLQKLTSLIPTYLRDSQHLLEDLKQLGRLPSNAQLFTADAVSMYTNIDSAHALQVIEDTLTLHREKLPEYFPTAALLDALRIVMESNVFEFESEHFKQLIGTAMGTPVACIYATLYYSSHEGQKLLVKYQSEILFLRRFIDDMFGVWAGTAERFEEFKKDLPFGLLTWEASPLGRHVDFLDLTININDDGYVSTRTFQKAMNLYLYIPAASAHPNGMIIGVINSLVRRFHQQNSKRKDFVQVVILLYRRLTTRGWNAPWIKQLILTAVTKAQQHSKVPTPNIQQQPTKNHSIFLHLQYHPNDVPQNELRAIYAKNCKHLEQLTTDKGKDLSLTSLTIAYSRAKNLRDILTSARLHPVEGKEVKHYFEP